MKKIFTFLLLLPFASAFSQIEGTWKLSAEAQALAVGPSQGDFSWWSNSAADVTTRACLFDDEFVFNADGSFMNVQGDETWLETWQGVAAEMCGTPVAPHDGSNAATWTWDSASSSVTIDGTGAHIGLAKVNNSGELTDPSQAPSSITYPVSFSGADTFVVDIDYGGGFWHFVFARKTEPFDAVGAITGTWKLSAQAQALAVGPSLGDFSWWSNSAGDVTTRACLFDDEFVFNADGSFMNVQGAETWLETWQGVAAEMCGAPVAPHDGSSAATWSYDSATSSITIDGKGAHIGLAKVHNGGELTDPNDAPASITYPVTFSGSDTMIVDIDYGGGFWHFVFAKSADATNVTELVHDLFKVFPNPASTEIQVQANRKVDQITVRDLSGREVFVKMNPSLNERIEVSDLPRGLYLLEARTETQRSIQKFILN